MSKALSIALAVLIVTFLVPPAQAQTTPAPLSPIEKQEIGRRNDPRLFNTGQVTPVVAERTLRPLSAIVRS